MKNAFVALVGFVALAGCTAQATTTPDPVYEPAPTVPLNGTLTVDWTINGAADPNACAQSVSPTFQISIAYDDGTFVGTYQQACEAFATSITLGPGRYTARAELVDAADNPRTTSIDLVPFTIVGNDELHVPVDFPARSFF